MLKSTKRNVRRARSLRRKMTLPEVLLWQQLRVRPDGLKFRRQHPAGPYVLDFYCEEARLCIEVDGAVHEFGGAQRDDARRDAWLREAGIDTLRVAARASSAICSRHGSIIDSTSARRLSRNAAASAGAWGAAGTLASMRVDACCTSIIFAWCASSWFC